MAQQTIIGIVLAAGRSTRMGEINKLTKVWRGKALVSHVVEAARSSLLSEVVVVTGHQSELVCAQLSETIPAVHNPEYASGMASSLRVGIQYALENQADAAMILLGDMPLITPRDIEALLIAYQENLGETIVQATCLQQPGNPVLFSRSLFDDLLKLDGDMGARDLIKRHRDHRILVEIGEAAARDFDSPDAFESNSAGEA